MRPDYSTWTGQYVLSSEPANIPGWISRPVAGRTLTHHPALPIAPVRLGGEEAGALVGWPVSPAGELVTRLDLPVGVEVAEAAYAFGGRWLLVTSGAVYLDAAGSQPAVYHAESRTVASSPGLIDAEDNDELVAAFDVVARDGWYPFGLTPKRGVKRLLPNHVLDLETFEAQRHHAGPEPGSVSVEAAASVVIDAVRSVASAFQEVEVGLTAGRDSRLLLAALRSHLDTVGFRTGYTGLHAGNLTDVQIAQKLAQRHGFRHRVREAKRGSEADHRGWLDRVGWVRAGARGTYAPSGEPPRVTFNGAVGEVARAYYRRDGHGPLGPEEACEIVEAPAMPVVVDAAATWLEGLPFTGRLRTLDMLYLEQRVGCWASSGNCGEIAPLPVLYPFTRRDAIDAMLGMPEDAKRSGALAEEGIRQAWPELLALPFNEPVGWLGAKARARNATARARFVLGGVKQRLVRRLVK